MLFLLLGLALLWSADGPAARKGSPGYDPDRVVCKYDLEPGSRLKRRKTCFTAAQWDELKRTEQTNLLRNQYNGSPK